MSWLTKAIADTLYAAIGHKHEGASYWMAGLPIALNHDFLFASGQNPQVLTTVGDGNIAADSWRGWLENASLQYRRYMQGEDGIDLNSFGVNSCEHWQQITNKGKFMIGQVIPAEHSAHLSGRDVRFQMMLRSNVARYVKVGLLRWTGTADQVPQDIVQAWSADNYQPVFVSGIEICQIDYWSLTDAFQTFAFNGTDWYPQSNYIVVVLTNAGVEPGGWIEASAAEILAEVHMEII